MHDDQHTFAKYTLVFGKEDSKMLLIKNQKMVDVDLFSYVLKKYVVKIFSKK